MDNIEQIKLYLKERKYLEIIQSQKQCSQAFGNFIFAKNSQFEYAFFAIPNDIYDESKELNDKLTILKSNDHPNILKLKDQFTFNEQQIIQTQMFEMSLEDWITQNKNQHINKFLFTNLALQILDAFSYLQQKKYIINNFSNQNILIDKNQRIKLYEINSSFYSQHFSYVDAQTYLSQKANKSFYYLPPELIEQIFAIHPEELLASYNYECKIWAIGISLYLLAGASLNDVINLKKGDGQYTYQTQIDEDINRILEFILNKDPKKRPSIIQAYQKFQEIKKLEETSQSIESKEEDQILFQNAKSLFENQQFNESKIIMRDLAYRHPINDMYLAWYGRTLSSLYELDEAFIWCNKSLELNPQNEIGLYALGVQNFRSKNFQEAIDCYLKVLNINPRFESALYNLGLVYDESARIEEAILYYNKVLELNPNKVEALNNLGLIYKNKNDYKQSIQYYLQALKANPKYKRALYNVGMIKNDQRKYNESLYYYHKSLVLSPNDHEIINNIGTVYYQKKCFDKSVKSFVKALKLKQLEPIYSSNVKAAKKQV